MLRWGFDIWASLELASKLTRWINGPQILQCSTTIALNCNRTDACACGSCAARCASGSRFECVGSPLVRHAKHADAACQ